MPVSPLTQKIVSAAPSNYTQGRPGGEVTKITVHHAAGKLTAEQIGGIFQNPGRNGSSHYGIGYDGTIASYVDEGNTAWTDSNWDSNIHSITIENSNSALGGDWPVSSDTLNSLISLCTDIAKRYNLGKLTPGENLTWHSMYAATACPGDFLRAHMQYIADEANKQIDPSPAPAPTPAPSTGINVGDVVVPIKYVDYNGTPLIQTRSAYYVSDINGDRAVLRADSLTGAVYAAVNVNNLSKVGEPSPAPAPAPSEGIKAGDKVELTAYVDYAGTPLVKTREYYYVSEVVGDRAVLRADSMSGVVYAAVNTGNLKKI